jgi:hypothetical protein
MELQDLVYGTCHDYVCDMHHAFSLDQYNVITGKLRARDYKGLSGVSSLFDPAKQGAESLRALLQVEAFFKKNAIFSDRDACVSHALSSFLTSEKNCAVTNNRLEHYSESDVHSIHIERMISTIGRCLGSFESFLTEIPRHWKVGSGATLALARKKSFPNVRLRRYVQCNAPCLPYLNAARSYMGLRPQVGGTTPFNRVEFVPKSWKTHRTIACEPEGNSFMQASFDSYLRKPLIQHFGVDLRHQDRNQQLAYEASLSGQLSTVDLEAASDSLSLNLVHLLFPREWAKFLCCIRSPFGRLPSGIIRYEKFASMGNGTTFPIETLVFAAACEALGSKQFCVYGDDIIIETDLVPFLVSLLAYLGFNVNSDKTHTSGFYRESCGHHYYKGEYITPLYIRDLDRRKPNLSLFVNNLWRMVPFEGKVWARAVNISQHFKLRPSPQLGDMLSGVHVSAYHGYRHKLIRSDLRDRMYIPCVRVYSYRTIRKRYTDVRSYLLWFIYKSANPWDMDHESSGYSLGTHKYASKWVSYSVAQGGPDHAFAWSDFYFAKAK